MIPFYCNPRVLCVHAQLCLILCNSLDYSPSGSSVHVIFQARILEWVAISSSRSSSLPRDRTLISWVSCIDRQILYHCTTWEASGTTCNPAIKELRPGPFWLADDPTCCVIQYFEHNLWMKVFRIAFIFLSTPILSWESNLPTKKSGYAGWINKIHTCSIGCSLSVW